MEAVPEYWRVFAAGLTCGVVVTMLLSLLALFAFSAGRDSVRRNAMRKRADDLDAEVDQIMTAGGLKMSPRGSHETNPFRQKGRSV